MSVTDPFPECPHYEPIIDVDRSDGSHATVGLRAKLEAVEEALLMVEGHRDALRAALDEAKREIIKLRADNARLSRQVILWARQ